MLKPFSPDTLAFCLLSFEGLDRYSQAGGLGVRITHLSEMLATLGFETHLLFVGDPNLPGREHRFLGVFLIVLGLNGQGNNTIRSSSTKTFI